MSDRLRWQPGQAVTPRYILERGDLRPGPKLLYGIMAAYGRRNQVCFASVPSLAQLLGLTERTIQRYLRQLTAASCITPTAKLGRSTSYQFQELVCVRPPSNEGVTGTSPLTATVLSPPGDRTVTRRIYLPLEQEESKRVYTSKGVDTPPVENQPSAHTVYTDLLSALSTHATAIQRTKELATDTDLLDRLTAAAQGYPRLAAYVIDRISRQRFGSGRKSAPAWPESLGYWITVVREEARKYLMRNRPR